MREARDYAVSADANNTHVNAYLSEAAGKTGMVQFSRYHDTLGYAADCLPLGSPNRIACHPTSDGGCVTRSGTTPVASAPTTSPRFGSWPAA